MTISVSAFSKLLAATAIGTLVVSGAVYADSNRADVTQTGADNSASVNQSVGEDHQTFLIQNEDRNQATITQRSNVQNQYFNPNGNKLGRLTDAAKQDGDDNKLTVYQDFIGNSANEIGTGGAGLDQVGDANAATINQYGSRNIVTELQQTSTGAVGNTIVINQGLSGSLSAYAYNRVDAAHQTGTNNEATLTQSGPSGSLNRIVSFVQNGSDNEAEVTQTGVRNALELVEQLNAGNKLVVSFSGDRNGSSAALDGLNAQGVAAFAATGRGFAAANGVQQGVIKQNGGDDIMYAVTGNRNLIGIVQGDADNKVSGTIGGDDNQLAISQNRTGGTGHSEATVNISSVGNDVSVTQTISSGGKNALVDLDVSGLSNSVNIVQGQGGNGRDSTVDVSITGDFNNSVSAFTTNGAAWTALGSFSARQAGSGQIRQSGSGNQLTYTLDGNSNQFAFRQTSTNNTISGSTTGDFNQVAVVQAGSGNTTNFTQIGGSNNLGVSQ